MTLTRSSVCPNCGAKTPIQFGHAEVRSMRRALREASDTWRSSDVLLAVQVGTSSCTHKPVAQGQPREGSKAQETKDTTDDAYLCRVRRRVSTIWQVRSGLYVVSGLSTGSHKATEPPEQPSSKHHQVRDHTGGVRRSVRCSGGSLCNLSNDGLGSTSRATTYRSLPWMRCCTRTAVRSLQYGTGGISR